MQHFKKELEHIANIILEQNAVSEHGENKPNYSNREFLNTLIIFKNALMDKMWDNQELEKMPYGDRMVMIVHCGSALHDLVFTYTGLDTRKIEDFV